MDTAYKGLKGIVKSQIIQEKPNFFTLNMEIDGDYNELIQNQFISNLKDRLGQNISCKVNIVEEIPLGANGKFIAVKRNFKLDDALLALRSQKTDS